MQIQPPLSAAQAASIAAQASSKDSSAQAAGGTESSVQKTDAQLEKSGDSSPDRDAQGQGDGLADDENAGDQNDVIAEVEAIEEILTSDLPPIEPPSQIDMIG